ncbi:MAG: sodium/proline symporter PutP [Treponema sp.]|nr:sodium/proline symporter PutP [Treponema sp.]
MSNQGAILITFFVYFSIIIGIALYFRRSQNLSDYFLGGRTLNAWVGALSAQASDFSGWLLMGLPGAIYAAGTGRAWVAVGNFVGLIINWMCIAKRLRRYTITAKNSITLPEYLENRFHDTSRALKTTTAVFFAIFFTVYTAAGFVAGGTLLSSIFGLNYTTAMVLTALFIVLYTLIGGFLAVSVTDTLQGMMMLLGIAILPWVALNAMGGWANVSAEVPAGFFNMLADGRGGRISGISIISDMAWGLGYFGMPHILVRFMAIKSEKSVSISTVIAIIWAAIGLSSAVLVGVVGFAFVPGLANRETVLINMIDRIFLSQNAVIAIPVLGGFFLCGIFAAIISTADSQLLVASSSLTGDIYRGLKKTASDKHLVMVSRLSVLAVAVIAFIIALNPAAGVMALISNAWAGLGSAFGPLVLISLFWRRITRMGAVVGIIVGGLTVIIWEYIPLAQGQVLGSYTGLYSLIPGFFLSVAAILAVSLSGKQPSAEILAEFETASKPLVEQPEAAKR